MTRYASKVARTTWQGRLNLTPLIDIVFQLIVFFLLVSQVVSAEREPMHLPVPVGSQAREKECTDRLVINLFADADGKVGRIKVNARVVPDLSALVGVLLAQRSAFSESGTRVILRADRRICFDQIEPVLKALSNASVGSLEIATGQQNTSGKTVIRQR